MAKRFIDTELFQQEWFVGLEPAHKMYFMFLTISVDIGGIIRPNPNYFKMVSGLAIKLDEFVSAVNADKLPGEKRRLYVLPNGRLFIPGFFRFQISNDTFSFENPYHLGALKCWIANEIHPFDVLGKNAENTKSLSMSEIAMKGLRRGNKGASEDHSRGRVALLDREYAKRIEDLEVSIGDTISNEEKFDITSSSNIVSLSQKKSTKKNSENSPPPTGAKRGRPRKHPLPLIAEPPELVTDSGEPIIAKPVPRPKAEKLPLVMPFDSERFSAAWEKWRSYRKEVSVAIGERLFPYDIRITEQGALDNLKTISGGDEDRAISYIDFSISIGWKSICKPNPQKVPHGATTANGTNSLDPLAAATGWPSGVFSSATFTASPGGAVRGRGGSIADLQKLKRS